MAAFEQGTPVVRPRQPEAAFIGPDGLPWGDETVGRFWSWAFSDLLANTTRGQLAEFIVGAALNALPPFANRWESYDLLTPDGVRLEVKSAGLRQAWHQERPSLPRFSIRTAFPWDAATNRWGEAQGRNSDVYVFALHEETSLEHANPLDLRQWSFRALATQEVERLLASQKSVGLTRLSQLAPHAGTVDELPRLLAQALQPHTGA